LTRQVRERLSQEYAVGAVFVAALFMSIMDSTVVNVAIPTLGREFDAGNASIEWVVTAYLLSLAVFIPASGWIGDRFGSKRVFLGSLALFTLGSVLCGAAQSLPELVLFRVVQGAGGGVMTPVGTAMLFRAFPPHRRARASQVLIVPTVLAPALGPIIGGLLIEHLSWRWVFYVNVPVGIVAFLFGAVFLLEYREATAGRFDLPGFVLSAAGLALVLYAISEGPVKGWLSGPVVGAAVVGVAACVALVRVELARRQPMFDLRLLEDRLFRTSNAVCLFAYAAFLGLLFVMPLFLQEARGASALSSGLTTFPEAVGVLVSSQLLVARQYPKVGPRRLMTGGLVVMVGLTASMAWLTADTSEWVIRALMFLTGGAMAYVILPQQAATFATISTADTGRASAIYNTQRQTAAALGVAILATVLTTTAGSLEAPRAGDFAWVFVGCAVLAALGALVAWTIRDEDAASTMAGGEPPAEAIVA
jgi:EmrB/QacA subfamily drug resistance transporter